MLQDRILAYITASKRLVALTKLVSVATDAGFAEDEVLQAIQKLGNKIKGTVIKGEVYYQLPPPPKTVEAFGQLPYPDCDLADWGKPIPFYSPEVDGPTPVFSRETNIFLKNKNDQLKRNYDQEKNARSRTKARHFAISH